MTTPGGLDATATAVLRFDASAVRPGVLDANSSLQQLYGTVKDNWWGIRNLGEVFAGLGAIISGGLGGATAAAVGFEQATSIIFKNVSDSATLVPARMKEIRLGLEDISTRSPVALDNLVKIAQQGALFGIASDQVVGFTKSVADLTVGTNLTVSDIGNLKKVMNEFKLPIDEIDRMGSALFVAEKNTSASAPAILTLVKNYGSVFNAIGATADQAIALSAILVSQGGQAQSSATALQNLFLKVGEAQRGNLPLFENYAKVAGLTVQQFKDMLASNPVEALVHIAGGLSSVAHNSADLSAVTTDLGLVNKRQVLALEDLASSYSGVAGGAAGLETVLQRTKAAFNDTSAYQKEVQRQTQTTSNQIQILKNDLQVLSIGIGANVLPALNSVVHVLQTLVLGFNALPNGVKVGIDIFGAATGGLLLFGGAMLLVLPRLAQAGAAIAGLRDSLLAYEAIQAQAVAITLANEGAEAAAALTSIRFGASRRAAMAGVIAAEEAFQASLGRTIAMETAQLGAEITATAATEAAAAADAAYAEREALLVELSAARLAGNSALAASLGIQVSAATEASAAAGAHALALAADAEAALAAATAMEVETAAMASAAAAETAGTPIAIAFGLALDFMTGPIGLVVLGVTALVALIAGLVYWLGRGVTETDRYKDANASLSQQLSQTGADVSNITNAFILQQKGMLEVIDTTKRLGISITDLFAVIRGDASAAVTADVVAKLNQAIKDGVPGAQAAANAIDSLNKTVVASQAAASSLSGANKALGQSTDSATASTLGLTDAQKKVKTAQDVAAQAALSLVDAQRSLADANVAVTDAEKRLSDAREQLNLRTVNIQTAEDSLASARLNEQDATAALATAEEKLKTSRADAAEKSLLDKLALAKAKAQEVLDTQKLTTAQEALNGAQSSADAQLASKTERLADARRILFQATKNAADAEYNLLHLKEIGANAQDIAGAQQAVATAQGNQDAAQQQVDEIANTPTTAVPASQLAAQQAYNVAAAQEALAQSQNNIIDLTRRLAQDQKDAAHDQSYKNAAEAVTKAQIAVRTATDQVGTATRALAHELKDNPEAAAYATAQRDVSNALFARAKAVVDVEKYTFELSGKTFTAEQQVAALHKALLDQATSVSGTVRSAMVRYANELDVVAGKITGMPTTIAPLTGPNTAVPQKNILHVGQLITDLKTTHEGTMDRIFRFVSPNSVSGQIALFVLSPITGLLNFLRVQFTPQVISIFKDMWHAAFSSIGHEIDSVLGKGAAKAIASSVVDVGKSAFNDATGFLGIPFTLNAKGGVYDKPTLGMFGEAGAEAIMPLSDLKSMLAPIAALTAQLAQSQRAITAMHAETRTQALMAGSGTSTTSKKTEVTINNPVAERSSDTLPRVLRNLDFVGA